MDIIAGGARRVSARRSSRQLLKEVAFLEMRVDELQQENVRLTKIIRWNGETFGGRVVRRIRALVKEENGHD